MTPQEHNNAPLLNTCGTCKHFKRHELGAKVGTCTRYPPQFVLHMTDRGPMTAPAFPVIDQNLSCGEHDNRNSVRSFLNS